MTYGEAWYENKCLLETSDTLSLEDETKWKLPTKMNNKDASRYYNIKLFNHWVYDYEYDKRATIAQIKELVSALMFGNKDRYKEFEELI
jgi:hypothetical protein